MTGYTRSISEIPKSTSEDNKSVKKTAATDFRIMFLNAKSERL